MSNWKIKRSRKAGTIPHVGQFPDSDTVIWNQADARLWGLRVDGSGNKTVVLIGGGINTIGETHQRLHAMDSEADHAAANEEDYGKFLRANPDTGKIEFVDYPYLKVIPLAGYSSYITLSQYGITKNLVMVKFLMPYDGGYSEIETHYKILSDGRLFYHSTIDLTGSVLILKQ